MTKHVLLEDLLNDQDDQAKEMNEWLKDYEGKQEEMSPRLYGPNVPKQREMTQEELEEKLNLSKMIIEGKISKKMDKDKLNSIVLLYGPRPESKTEK